MMERLGKRLAIGETFLTTTNRMSKNRTSATKWNEDKTGPLCTYEVLRPGDKRFFTKGKRRYYCQVIALVETRTGVYNPTAIADRLQPGPRWWIFTYLVRILEN
jgi:hypothetical protein